MKTRIIQDEPAAETSEPAGEGVPEPTQRGTLLRRAFLTTAVVGYFILGIVHPANIEVGDKTTLYLWIHLIQPVLILLLAWSIWLLVEDLPGRAAQIARIAIVPYAIVYSMFDALAGVGLGQVIRQANAMNPADAAAIQRLLDDSGTDYIGMGLWIASGLAWFVMAFAAALAVKPLAGRGPTLLMAMGAAIFAIAHPFPTGPIGIALFGLGFAWLELRRDRAAVGEAQPVLAP
jgi:hypothetical protein